MDFTDFIDAVYETYEAIEGDPCPYDQDLLAEVFDLTDEDYSEQTLREAFDEAGIETDVDDQFFSDLASVLNEDTFS